MEGAKDPRRILVVLTDGAWAWDSVRVDFDLERSTAIHPELQGVFSSEPFVLDMRWAHQVERLTLRDARFRDCVATIAAPLHGRPKDDLEDEDTRYQRHVRPTLPGHADRHGRAACGRHRRRSARRTATQ